MQDKTKNMNIAIIGASGAVGQELLKILQERKFPCNSLRLFGSSRSAGTSYMFNGKPIVVEELTPATSFEGVDIAFASAGAFTSRQYAEQITRYGTILIDNSSAFRMDEDVPLVVPEINPEDALQALEEGSRHIIANPNCTTIIMAVVLNAVEPLSHIKRVHVATYQSASGAGAQAMQELQEQYNQIARGEQPTVQRFAHQLAYNVIPHIDVFADGDYTKEELKMYNETRKIMHSDIRVSAMPLDRSGLDKVAVGRLRKDLADDHSFSFFCVGDQIRKGAALNAIQIAETLLDKINE